MLIVYQSTLSSLESRKSLLVEQFVRLLRVRMVKALQSVAGQSHSGTSDGRQVCRQLLRRLLCRSHDGQLGSGRLGGCIDGAYG